MSIWLFGGFPAKIIQLLNPSRRLAVSRQEGRALWISTDFLPEGASICPSRERRQANIEESRLATWSRFRHHVVVPGFHLGYSVEWRVVNSAEYGFLRRKRVIFTLSSLSESWNLEERIGVLSSALADSKARSFNDFMVPNDLYEATQSFNGRQRQIAGAMSDHVVTV